MSSSNHQEDLDLLLSLQDRVLETPPGSPSSLHPHSPGYLSEDGVPKRMGEPDMSVFRNAVQDSLDNELEHNIEETRKLKRPKKSNDADVEKYSGLRIRDQLVSSAELSNHFSDRFMRLTAIKNLLMGETVSGCWATVGVLTEKGSPKTSSTGKNYCIWKMGCLDEKTVSIFLFNEAYQKNWKETSGTVFALFNCAVRKDAAAGTGYSLSIYSAGQMIKIGTSVDYGVCKGKRKDGLACTLVINKRRGIYCSYHKSKSSEKYSVMRTELKGGNLRTAFRQPVKSEGIYLVDPLADRTNLRKPMQPVKLLSVEALKKALSNAGKVTTNTHSQGIRFLTEITGKMSQKIVNKGAAVPKKQMSCSEKRLSSTMKVDASTVKMEQSGAKRIKTEQGQAPAMKSKPATEKMIELDYISSDEDR